jgi:Uma2 family endonuclease
MLTIGDVPEIEVLRGIEVPKVSPRRRHARLQGLFFVLLDRWAGAGGDVGTKWRLQLSKRPGDETSLVPDVAYVANARLSALDPEATEEPPFAPDIAVEVRSPGDRERNIQAKVALYLDAGALLVLDVDPQLRRITAHDADGFQVFEADDTFAHALAPGLAFDVGGLFAAADLHV